VVLKNQQKLNGIVKSNKFYEAESGMGFRTTTKEDRNAGLRLWFAHKGHNWLFLRYNEIQSVNTIGRVSDIEVREMEAKLDAELDARLLQENSERIAEVSAQVKALNDARQKEEAEAEAKKKAEAEQKKKDALDKATKLMDRFPESQGWSEEKKQEILSKKNNHLYPTAEEIEFLQLFPEWLKARKLLDNERKRAEGEPVEDEPEDPEEKTDGGGL
jgi:hypothetical protein